MTLAAASAAACSATQMTTCHLHRSGRMSGVHVCTCCPILLIARPVHCSNPREYFRMFESASWRDPAGQLHTLQLALCKCVDTYVEVKHNHNQVCWKWTKVCVERRRTLSKLHRRLLCA
jgi:hypothetical protein